MGGKFLQAKKLTISSTVKKKFFLALFIGFFLLGFLMLSFGITGTAFALPLGGMGDFYVKFSKLEGKGFVMRSEEHTSELQSRGHLVCRLLLEKKNNRSDGKWCDVYATVSRRSTLT